MLRDVGLALLKHIWRQGCYSRCGMGRGGRSDRMSRTGGGRRPSSDTRKRNGLGAGPHLCQRLRKGIREHCEVSRTFDGCSKCPLMLGAHACLASRLYLELVRYVPLYHRDFLVVYVFDVVNAKEADFSAGEIAWPTPPGRAASTRTIASCRHVLLLPFRASLTATTAVPQRLS